jgi:hypothetical protein
MKIQIRCECHNEGHTIDLKNISVKDAGRILYANRKKMNSPEHMKRISKLGVEARKKL